MTTQEQRCPRCKEDLTSYLSEKPDLEFCLFCRFPLGPIAGKYKLLETLGEGGFGTVYRAVHLTMQRDAERVIKVIKPEVMNKPGIKERFLREVQMTSALSQRNPHIVRVFDDFGEIPYLGHFYVMEYLKGKPLTDYLKNTESLPSVAWCLDVFAQLCDAMQAAHEEQIVHRDLKPDNIFLIHHRRRDNFVKVLDFGIAKPLNTDSNAAKAGKITQGIVGTPFYIAPEQATNGEIDARTDIYAMGVILHELLTGEIPLIPASRLDSISLVELLTIRIMAKEIPSLRRVRPDRDIPEGVDLAVQKALESKPDDRFPSAEAFWQALQPYARESTGYGLSHSGDAHLNPPSDPSLRLRGPSSPANSLPTGVSVSPSDPKHPIHPHPSLDATDDMLPTTPNKRAKPHPPALSNGVATPSPSTNQDPRSSAKIAIAGALLLLGILGTWLGLGLLRPSPSSNQPPIARLGKNTASQPPQTTVPSDSSKTTQNSPSQIPNTSPQPTPNQESESIDELPDASDTTDTDAASISDSAPQIDPQTSPKHRTKRRTKRRKTSTPKTTPSLPKTTPTQETTPTPPQVTPPKKQTPCADNEVFLITVPRLSLNRREISPSNACRAKANGYCIRADTKEVALEREGYLTCIFALPKRQTRLRAVLKEDEGGTSPQDYCLQKRK